MTWEISVLYKSSFDWDMSFYRLLATLKDIGDYIVDVICKPAGLIHNHGAISVQKDNSSA
ncbi:hypothetical protein Patl1_24483 [Pistacia atlantica]|uniref:Uncharacterized protein n=2 Tax=Pistacia atlantica TaxID=434234 RepID=A0ACC0ZVC1_9ROSI|nr:hypothetical protein Patl1_24488 [Pistacia atlantica]KAJ0078672.1 hypothetical protein Patl1_24483 [Pistacia atlantica]